VGLSWGAGIDRQRECWVKEWEGWVCWWVSTGSELVSLKRQAEGGLGQLFGWLGL